MIESESLPITQAAAVLEIGERRLRRMLEKPENAARTETTIRETRTGIRTAVTVPPALIEDLRRQIDLTKEPQAAPLLPAVIPTATLTVTETVTPYNQLQAEICEKNAEIAFLRSELAKTSAALLTLTINTARPEVSALPPPPRQNIVQRWISAWNDKRIDQ